MASFFIGSTEDDFYGQPVIDYKQFFQRPLKSASYDEEQIKSHRVGDKPPVPLQLTGIGPPRATSPKHRRRAKLSSSGGEINTSCNNMTVDQRHHDEATGDATPPHDHNTERLIELLFNDKSNGEPRQLFCELEELVDGVWCESARWVRFEEDVEIGGDRWSKPFVAAVPLHSLFELRHYLSTGAILLDVDGIQSFSQLVNLVADSLTEAKLLEPDVRARFVETLQLRHVHQFEHTGAILRRSFNEIGRKLSAWRMDENPQGETRPSEGHGAEASTREHGNERDGETPSPHFRQNEIFARKLPRGSEASTSLIGGVDYLKSNVSAFVRLRSKTTFHECSEVAIPTRFLFILLGPTSRAKDLREVGRAMETVMSDDIFRDFAYRGTSQADLLSGLDEFLDGGIALPPSEWDPKIRIEPPKRIPSLEERKMLVLTQTMSEKSLSLSLTDSQIRVMTLSRGVSETPLTTSSPGSDTPQPVTPTTNDANSASLNAFMDELLKKQAENEHVEPCTGEIDPELERTGRIFGGLIADVKRKLPWIRSDITDAFNIQCIASIFFLFFACLSPIVTFGGLLGLATDNNMAAFESILTGAVCGTTYHLFAGQPVTIIGSTGPVLLFEKILFTYSKENDLNYLTLRFWIGMWTAVIMMILVMLDLSCLVQLITRFTEECFATLISVIFIFEAFVAIHGIYQTNPISNQANLAVNYSCWCEWYGIQLNSTSAFDCRSLNVSQCAAMSPCRKVGPGCDLYPPVPNVFFFSCLLFVGTCGFSFALKNFRTSPYFAAKVRAVVSDFAVSISIVTMVGLDFIVALPTPKLVVPNEFAPTRHDRGWLIKPFVNPIWTIFATPFPAVLLSVLIFMDQQITAVIVNRREHKLVKGKGYHLDLFVLTLHIMFCASFGLPYFVAATVLAITHVNSLRKQSETSAPGEQPRFLGLIEQRVTGFMVFILIGCSVPLRGILKFIPMPVLYGVFLYMGLSAVRTSQFYNRCILVFMPVKHQPDTPYLRHMRTWRVHLFTAIQLTAFIVLWVVKQTKEISILFILMLVFMVVLRKLLDYVFTQEELQWVDDILPKNPLAVPKKKEEQGDSSAAKTKPAKNRSATSFWSRFRRGQGAENTSLRQRNLCPPPTIVVVSPSRETSTNDLERPSATNNP